VIGRNGAPDRAIQSRERFTPNVNKATLSRAAARTGVAAFVGVLVSLGGTTPAWAATNGGTPLIQDHPGHNINMGGSQTTWTITLPPGAACSGDTTHNFTVWSFLLDPSYNLNNVVFGGVGSGGMGGDGGPIPNTGGSGFANSLYDTGSNAYFAKATAPGTGQVIGIPSFNFANFSVDGSAGVALPTGPYQIGIACADGTNHVDKYWATNIVFSPSNDPNGESWQTSPNPQVPEFPIPLSLALPLSAAVLGGGYVVVRRRRSNATVGTA